MKKIFGLIAVFICAFYFGGGLFGNSIDTQEDVLSFTDTTALFGLPANAKYIAITIVDSSMTGTDTVKAYARTGGRPYYSLLALHEASQTTTTTNVTLLVPGAGVTSTYLVPDNVLVTELYLVRTNESTDDAYLPKTRIVVRYSY